MFACSPLNIRLLCFSSFWDTSTLSKIHPTTLCVIMWSISLVRVIYRLVLISKDGSSRLSDVKDINGKNLMQVSMRKILCKFQWGKLEISCLAVTVPWEVRMWFHAIENALQPPHPPPPPSRDAIRRKPFPCFISFLFYTNIGQCKMCYVDWKPVLFPVYTPYIYVCTIKLSTSIKDTRTYN